MEKNGRKNVERVGRKRLVKDHYPWNFVVIYMQGEETKVVGFRVYRVNNVYLLYV